MRIILSRSLGAEALGIYQVSLSFFGVLCTVISSGIPVSISHVSARCGVTKDYKKEGSYVSSGLIIGLIVSVILSLIIILFKNLIIKSTNEISANLLLILIPAIFATSIYSCFRGALWGREKHAANCLAELGEQSFRLILFIVLLNGVTDSTTAIYLAGLALCLSCFVSMLISIISYRKYGGKLVNPKYEYKNLLKTSSTITFTRIVTSLVQPIIAVVLPLRLVSAGLSQELALSLFGIALGMTMPLLALPSTICGSFSTAIIPQISYTLEQKKKNEFEEKVKFSYSLTLFISFCFVPLFMGLGSQIGILLFDNTMSGYLLSISAWTMVPMGLCGITTSILNILNLERKSFLTYFAGAIWLFACIWFLPQYCGVSSIIYGMGGSSIITSMLNCYIISKKTGIKDTIVKPLVLMSLFSVPASLLGTFTYKLLKYLLPKLFSIGIAGVICSGSFVILCAIFNLIDITSLIGQVKSIKIAKIKNKRTKSLSKN